VEGKVLRDKKCWCSARCVP